MSIRQRPTRLFSEIENPDADSDLGDSRNGVIILDCETK